MNAKPWILYWLSNQGNKQGTGFPPDWSQIGYEDTPDAIIDGFNYAKEIYDNWDNTQTNLSNKYVRDVNLIVFPMVDTSNATDTHQMFQNASHLIYVPSLNTSKVTNMSQMFNSCGSLKSIPQMDTSLVASFYNFCYNNGFLRDVPFYNIPNATTLNNMYVSCNNLSNESLNNIMASLLTATSYTGTKTLKYIGLSSAQATTCTTLSNWTELSNAGWTTGY